MQIQNNSRLSKLHSLIQEHGYSVIYVLWLTMELVLRCSSAELTFSLSPQIYIYAERYLKYALILYIIFFQRYSWKEVLIIASVSALLFYSARLSGFYELFYSWLFIAGARNTRLDRIVRLSFITLAVCISAFVILFKLGILVETGVARGEKFRSALGFVHPNNFGARIFMLCACWLFIRRNKLCIADYIVVLSIACFVWIVPNSRTSALSIVILSGLMFICNHFIDQNVKRRIYSITLFSGVLAANIGTVLLSVFYDGSKPFMERINSVLSGRLDIAHGLYKESGISVFGRRIYVTMSERIFAGLGNEAINFDNSYMRILLHWGIVVYILVSVFLLLTLVLKSREKDLSLFTVLTVVLLYSLSEKILYQAVYSVFIIAASDLLYRKNTPIKNADLFEGAR